MTSQPLVTDPVCGMRIDPSKAAGTSVFRGTTYYFCSVACTEKFNADSEAYLAFSARAGADDEAEGPEAWGETRPG